MRARSFPLRPGARAPAGLSLMRPARFSGFGGRGAGRFGSGDHTLIFTIMRMKTMLTASMMPTTMVAGTKAG